jgi:hypothetical protein
MILICNYLWRIIIHSWKKKHSFVYGYLVVQDGLLTHCVSSSLQRPFCSVLRLEQNPHLELYRSNQVPLEVSRFQRPSIDPVHYCAGKSAIILNAAQWDIIYQIHFLSLHGRALYRNVCLQSLQHFMITTSRILVKY